MVEIYEATEATKELVEAMERLVPQLSSSNPSPSVTALQEIIDSDAVTLLIARDHRGVIGMLSLVLFRIPTGLRAWIEDVIVDSGTRGRGVGRSLNEAAIERAVAAGAVTVDLTSRPAREAANRLYQKIGFERRETNVYRLIPQVRSLISGSSAMREE